MKTKIGQLIKEEVERQGLTANQFAKMISTSRTNVYHRFNRDNIDMELLIRISKALHRNFFTEMASETAYLLGTEAPPATMANLKLASLTHPLREECNAKFFSPAEYTKDRESLKVVLKEYFESDHRLPLLILETGYTYGAREVVKQVAQEVFKGCGSCPCPKLIDVAKVKIMPERVLVDYIDKNTFDSLEESDSRVNELCLVQKEVTKKFVCIIHTDPIVALPNTDRKVSFDQWGCELGIFLARYEQCFITIYRWNRSSLLSWAEDNRLHKYVVNYIRQHQVEKGQGDYQLATGHVTIGDILIGLPLNRRGIDYPTIHAYLQGDWEFVSKCIDQEIDKNEGLFLQGLIQDIIDFNEMDPEKYLSTRKGPKVCFRCDYSVDGYELQDELLIDQKHYDTLGYLYNLALQTDLKGLNGDAVDEQFYPWLTEHHPTMAQVLVNAANEKVAEELGEDPELREYIPHYEPQSIDDYWQVKEGLDYHFILSGRITVFPMD